MNRVHTAEMQKSNAIASPEDGICRAILSTDTKSGRASPGATPGPVQQWSVKRSAVTIAPDVYWSTQYSWPDGLPARCAVRRTATPPPR